MKEVISKTFKIEASKDVLEKFERLLALFHYNSRFGHSAVFGMFLDGDGDDKFTVEGIDESLRADVSAIGGVGYDVELANAEGYYGVSTDRKESKWYAVGGCLYKNGVIVKDCR